MSTCVRVDQFRAGVKVISCNDGGPNKRQKLVYERVCVVREREKGVGCWQRGIAETGLGPRQ